MIWKLKIEDTVRSTCVRAKINANFKDKLMTLEYHVYEGTQFRYKIICGTMPMDTILDKFFTEVENDGSYAKLSSPEDEDPDVRRSVLRDNGFYY